MRVRDSRVVTTFVSSVIAKYATSSTLALGARMG